MGRNTLSLVTYRSCFRQEKPFCAFTWSSLSGQQYQLSYIQHCPVVLSPVSGNHSATHPEHWSSGWKWMGKWCPVTWFQCLHACQTVSEQNRSSATFYLLTQHILTYSAKRLFQILAPCLCHNVTGVTYTQCVNCRDFQHAVELIQWQIQLLRLQDINLLGGFLFVFLKSHCNLSFGLINTLSPVNLPTRQGLCFFSLSPVSKETSFNHSTPGIFYLRYFWLNVVGSFSQNIHKC